MQMDVSGGRKCRGCEQNRLNIKLTEAMGSSHRIESSTRLAKIRCPNYQSSRRSTREPQGQTVHMGAEKSDRGKSEMHPETRVM